jgi:hypothetical protein
MKCASCDADVVFVPSAKSGKPMILNAKPAKGVIVTGESMHGLFSLDEPGGASVARVVDVYTDHHVTCPAAAEWRGKTRRDR